MVLLMKVMEWTEMMMEEEMGELLQWPKRWSECRWRKSCWNGCARGSTDASHFIWKGSTGS
jgi:hypothetical protein